jgi:hypothetical protein
MNSKLNEQTDLQRIVMRRSFRISSVIFLGILVSCDTIELLDTSSTETSIKSSSNTTHHSYYPDTFDPGAVVGVLIGSLLFIFAISIGYYYIRRQRIYYLPYFNDYHPI